MLLSITLREFESNIIPNESSPDVVEPKIGSKVEGLFDVLNQNSIEKSFEPTITPGDIIKSPLDAIEPGPTGVGVIVGVTVLVGVIVGVTVLVGVLVGVSVGVGVFVGVSVFVGVGVFVGVSVIVGVGVGVGVGCIPI
jgi:hypothetical protein